MQTERRYLDELLIGIVGVAETPEQSARVMGAVETCCRASFTSPIRIIARPVINELYSVEDTLRELSDKTQCDVIFTAGATGLSKADIVPQATRLVATYELPGIAEQMRRIQSLKNPAAMLSRQIAALRETPDHDTLIVNLPMHASDIPDVLRGVTPEKSSMHEVGVFDCLCDYLEQIGGPAIALRDAADEELEAEAQNNDTEVKLETPEPTMRAVPHEPRYPTYSQAMAAAREAHAATPPEISHVNPTAFGQTVNQRMSADAIARRSVQRGVRLVSDTNKRPFETLDVLVKDPENGRAPECTIVWLHGMGTQAEDFAPFAKEIVDFGGPESHFILPRAPQRPITVQAGATTTAWYDVLTRIGEEPEDLPGLKAMHLKISQIINQIVSQGTPAETIFLGGFSQGAAMALYSGLRQARTLAGVIALSGYLPAPQILDNDITPAGKMTPFFVAHGAFDSVINPVVARKSADFIEKHIDTLVWREYNMEHEVVADEMKHVVQFMSAALQS